MIEQQQWPGKAMLGGGQGLTFVILTEQKAARERTEALSADLLSVHATASHRHHR